VGRPDEHTEPPVPTLGQFICITKISYPINIRLHGSNHIRVTQILPPPHFATPALRVGEKVGEKTYPDMSCKKKFLLT